MIVGATSGFFAAGRALSNEPPFQGYTPLVGFDLTDETTITTSGTDFTSASPVTESIETGDLYTTDGLPQYVTGSGPSHVFMDNNALPGLCRLQNDITVTTTPTNRDQTVLAIYAKGPGDLMGYVWDSNNARTTTYINNDANITPTLNASSFTSEAAAQTHTTVYGVAVTGSNVTNIELYFGQLGNVVTKFSTGRTGVGVTYPTSFSVGERYSPTEPLNGSLFYGWARFSSILAQSDIQTIFDRFAAKFA